MNRQTVVRVSRGVYAPAGARHQELRALFARLPDGTVLGFGSAAGAFGFGRRTLPDDPVHVIVPAGRVRPRIRGVICHEAALPVAAPVLLAGVPCAPPARCAVDLARHAGRLDGLAILDAALRAGACTAADLAEEVISHDGLRGVRQARELIRLADGRAECAQESHLRLTIIDAGLPAPEPQVWVYDNTGRQIYRLDLAYREQRVGLEYDGRSHLSTSRLDADRTRMNWLNERGWAMRYFTGRDLYRSPGLVVATVRSALR